MKSIIKIFIYFAVIIIFAACNKGNSELLNEASYQNGLQRTRKIGNADMLYVTGGANFIDPH